jgi:SAM-dependent methyltransferase
MTMRAAIRGLIQLLSRLRMWLLSKPLFTSVVLPTIPRPIRWMLRRLYFTPFDIADRILGRREEFVPPKSKIFTGSVDGFKASGERLVQMLEGLAGLKPDTKIVDIGSGMGRLAVPLTRYLSLNGRYEGLDVVESGIRWCNETIAPKHPNFRFTLADVFNKEYNPSGRLKPSEYRFPYADGSVDLVVLASVFTHMLPTDMEWYVSEISRVLKKGGRCFATYFLVNHESRRRMDAGESSLRFRHELGTYSVVNTKVPELGVGYDEGYVRDVLNGLFGHTTIYYGGWCGRPPLWSPESGLGDQDVVLATK